MLLFICKCLNAAAASLDIEADGIGPLTKSHKSIPEKKKKYFIIQEHAKICNTDLCRHLTVFRSFGRSFMQGEIWKMLVQPWSNCLPHILHQRYSRQSLLLQIQPTPTHFIPEVSSGCSPCKWPAKTMES
jgi:hypothetical protein